MPGYTPIEPLVITELADPKAIEVAAITSNCLQEPIVTFTLAEDAVWLIRAPLVNATDVVASARPFNTDWEPNVTEVLVNN